MTAMLRCEGCASPLDLSLLWAQLIAERPEVFICSTAWGDFRFEFGVQEVQVRCRACGQTRLALRTHPLAVA